MSDEKVNEWSLKELAAETGVPERTIRFYISRGLLDPPLRGGRSAAYGEKHKARLEDIRMLQAKGMMLAHIAHALTFESVAKAGRSVCTPPAIERTMLWFEPNGSVDRSSQDAVSEAGPMLVDAESAAAPSFAEPETWRSYSIAPDVRVMLKAGAGPWRTKRLVSALRRFAAEIELETKREDKGE